jgi:hypothetical protein
MEQNVTWEANCRLSVRVVNPPPLPSIEPEISLQNEIVLNWFSLLRHCATSRKVAGSIPDVVTGIIRRLHYDPLVDPASNRNEYQGYFMGVKAAGA